MQNEVSKSFFAVFANPELHGYPGTPEEICERLRQEWIQGGEGRTGAWTYCISHEGLRHVHMVLESPSSMRFEALKAVYAPGTHFELTKGTKAQAEAYITKAPPYDEQGEQVLCLIRHGEIKGRQGKRSDLDEIEDMLKAGMTPDEIFAQKLRYRRFEKLIRADYAARCKAKTPVKREVQVHFFVGPSGSGKSYRYVELCEKYGEDQIYHVVDYTTGGFDLYAGEKILFLDEFKGQVPYATLLSLLDGYRTQVHARYANVFMMWGEVYITSVYPPEELHRLMVAKEYHSVDAVEQLYRRISDITYCYRDAFGYFRRYTIPMKDYAGYAELIKAAEWAKMEDAHQMTIEELNC